MSSHLKAASKPQFDTWYWCIFCTHPHWKQCKAHNYCWRRWECCLGKEGRSFSAHQNNLPPPAPIAREQNYAARTDWAWDLCRFPYIDMHTLERSILFEKHSGWNYTVLCSSRICVMVWKKTFPFFWTGSICVRAPPCRVSAVLLSLPQTCSLDTKQKRSLPAPKPGKGAIDACAQIALPHCQITLNSFFFLKLQAYFSLV